MDVKRKNTQNAHAFTAFDVARPFFFAVNDKETSIDDLIMHIRSGDIKAVRSYFDRVFYEKRDEQATWLQLREALLQKDPDMIRLLVNWGARPTSVDLDALRAENPAAFDDHLRMMRRAGLRRSIDNLGEIFKEAVLKPDFKTVEDAASAPETTATSNRDITPADIPYEWEKMLETLHAMGAREAIIAGGALRDLENGRPVRDVDIFLSHRQWNNHGNFIKDAMILSGLQKDALFSIDRMHKISSDDYSYSDPQHLRNRLKPQKTLKKTIQEAVRQCYFFTPKSTGESWTVKTSLYDDTEFNIVFVKGPLADSLKKGWINLFVEHFDIGICKIAYLGKNAEKPFLRNAAYKDDRRAKKITLDNINIYSKEHLDRIVKKYPDWELCPKAKALRTASPPTTEKTKQKPSFY